MAPGYNFFKFHNFFSSVYRKLWFCGSEQESSGNLDLAAVVNHKNPLPYDELCLASENILK